MHWASDGSKRRSDAVVVVGKMGQAWLLNGEGVESCSMLIFAWMNRDFDQRRPVTYAPAIIRPMITPRQWWNVAQPLQCRMTEVGIHSTWCGSAIGLLHLLLFAPVA